MLEQEAIEAALEAYRQPQTFHVSRRKPLPNGMLALLRLVSAAPEEVNSIVTDETAKRLPVREAAIFYLQQVLTKAEDDYRQLALSRGASLQEVKDHKRLLLKWLHPDRNSNSWENSLFQRVTVSATRLENALCAGAEMQIVQPGGRRRHRSKPGLWAIAQRRVKTPTGWKTRFFKIAIVVAVTIALLALAQLSLTTLQTANMGWNQSALHIGITGSFLTFRGAG